jgi:hypothetical protein
MFVSLLYSIVIVKLTSLIGICENEDDGNDDVRKEYMLYQYIVELQPIYMLGKNIS